MVVASFTRHNYSRVPRVSHRVTTPRPKTRPHITGSLKALDFSYTSPHKSKPLRHKGIGQRLKCATAPTELGFATVPKTSPDRCVLLRPQTWYPDMRPTTLQKRRAVARGSFDGRASRRCDDPCFYPPFSPMLLRPTERITMSGGTTRLLPSSGTSPVWDAQVVRRAQVCHLFCRGCGDVGTLSSKWLQLKESG